MKCDQERSGLVISERCWNIQSKCRRRPSGVSIHSSRTSPTAEVAGFAVAYGSNSASVVVEGIPVVIGAIEDPPAEVEGRPISEGELTIGSSALLQPAAPPKRHSESATTSPARGSDPILMITFCPRDPRRAQNPCWISVARSKTYRPMIVWTGNSPICGGAGKISCSAHDEQGQQNRPRPHPCLHVPSKVRYLLDSAELGRGNS